MGGSLHIGDRGSRGSVTGEMTITEKTDLNLCQHMDIQSRPRSDGVELSSCRGFTNGGDLYADSCCAGSAGCAVAGILDLGKKVCAYAPLCSSFNIALTTDGEDSPLLQHGCIGESSKEAFGCYQELFRQDPGVEPNGSDANGENGGSTE
jgi:hypothetical protein